MSTQTAKSLLLRARLLYMIEIENVYKKYRLLPHVLRYSTGLR